MSQHRARWAKWWIALAGAALAGAWMFLFVSGRGSPYWGHSEQSASTPTERGPSAAGESRVPVESGHREAGTAEINGGFGRQSEPSPELTASTAEKLAESLFVKLGLRETRSGGDDRWDAWTVEMLEPPPQFDRGRVGTLIDVGKHYRRGPNGTMSNKDPGVLFTFDSKTGNTRYALATMSGWESPDTYRGPKLTQEQALQQGWQFVSLLSPSFPHGDYALTSIEHKKIVLTDVQMIRPIWVVEWHQIIDGVRVWEGNIRIVFHEEVGLGEYLSAYADPGSTVKFAPKISKDETERLHAPAYISWACQEGPMSKTVLNGFNFKAIRSTEPRFCRAYDFWSRTDGDGLGSAMLSPELRPAWKVMLNVENATGVQREVDLLLDADTGKPLDGSMSGGF